MFYVLCPTKSIYKKMKQINEEDNVPISLNFDQSDAHSFSFVRTDWLIDWIPPVQTGTYETDKIWKRVNAYSLV